MATTELSNVDLKNGYEYLYTNKELTHYCHVFYVNRGDRSKSNTSKSFVVEFDGIPSFHNNINELKKEINKLKHTYILDNFKELGGSIKTTEPMTQKHLLDMNFTKDADSGLWYYGKGGIKNSTYKVEILENQKGYKLLAGKNDRCLGIHKMVDTFKHVIYKYNRMKL